MSVSRFRTRSWLPSRPLARRSRGPLLGGVWLHCRTRRRARRLDSELAAGVDPMQSDELSLRVGQLRSAKGRRSLACALRGAVELAYRQGAIHCGCRLRRSGARSAKIGPFDPSSPNVSVAGGLWGPRVWR